MGIDIGKNVAGPSANPNRSNVLPRPTLQSSTNSKSRPMSSLIKSVETSSQKKLGNIEDKYSGYSSCSEEYVNIVISLGLLSNVLAQSVVYSSCGSAGLKVSVVSKVGLACKLELSCQACQFK